MSGLSNNDGLHSGNAPHVYSIVPPYMLRIISSSASVKPEIREAATQTLLQTNAFREIRSSFAAGLSHADKPSLGAFIIPSYMLQAIVSETTDPEAREAAQRSLDESQAFRWKRQSVFDTTSAETVRHAVLNRFVFTSANTKDLPGTLVRSEGQPSSDDPSINECYDGFKYTFDFFHKIFGRNSIDNNGMHIVGSVHYGNKFQNAVWNGSQMVFGDGDGTIFITGCFTKNLDIIGHEFTYGVTAHTANLQYQGESGALNESMSDVFGSMVKQYYLQQKAEDADWLIGAGIFGPSVKGHALRSLKAPGTAYEDLFGSRDPQPAHMQHYSFQPFDSGGMHINSGIPNNAFYRVAIGLGGYSWEKAGKIWYNALTDSRLKFPATVTFKSFADITCEYALKMDQQVKNVVVNAWTAVGVV